MHLGDGEELEEEAGGGGAKSIRRRKELACVGMPCFC